jgi:hypothetical protein
MGSYRSLYIDMMMFHFESNRTRTPYRSRSRENKKEKIQFFFSFLRFLQHNKAPPDGLEFRIYQMIQNSASGRNASLTYQNLHQFSSIRSGERIVVPSTYIQYSVPCHPPLRSTLEDIATSSLYLCKKNALHRVVSNAWVSN